jgi:hypothetical protein
MLQLYRYGVFGRSPVVPSSKSESKDRVCRFPHTLFWATTDPLYMKMSTSSSKASVQTKSLTPSSASSTSNSVRSRSSSLQKPESEMHQKLTGQMCQQMRTQQERWAAWQARQVQCFQTASTRSKQDPTAEDAYTVKRQHPHLNRIGAWARRVRG